MAGPPDGLRHEEAIRLGEQMYRDGILSSGASMQAIAQGDIAVDGRMFACVSCHLRSGLGSIEGTIISPPVTGVKLFMPRPRGQGIVGGDPKTVAEQYRGGDIRPAYTVESLSLAIRGGEDAAGNRLDPFMPRYMLEDRDLGILIYYLQHLSAGLSPGVTETSILFATVVTADADASDRSAMVDTLRAYLKDRGVQTRRQHKRAAAAGAYMEEMDRSFRAPILLEWELKGSPDTWEQQLGEHYAQKPVFALVGGISGGEWGPVHRFCEKRGIPCVFPMTDFPVISEQDWYTVYVSKGLYQEGETAALFLSPDDIEPADVLTVYRDTREGRTLSAAFRDTARALGRSLPVEEKLAVDQTVSREFWKGLADRHSGKHWVLWLKPDDLAHPDAIPLGAGGARSVLVSYGLLGEEAWKILRQIKGDVRITYPYRLPQDRKRQELVVKQWLKIRKIPLTNMKIQAVMYDLGVLLTDTLMMMQSNYVRDYFLDVIDMMRDHTYTIAVYPRLSFGSGQRYASKGCYVARPGSGDPPQIVPVSDWVVH